MEFWFTRGLAFLPIFVIVWSYLTFMISYIISVDRGDVDPGFPFISDTGARRPESSVFGQMLNITAVATLACFYVRYKQVESFLMSLPDEKIRRVKIVNKVSWYLGIFICLGISLVANFQETSVLAVHVIGAMLTFGVGTIYEFLHSYISYKMHPEVNSLQVCHVRLVLALLSAIFLITSMVSANFMGAMIKLHWSPEDPGYSAHLTSTITEWLLAASFLVYFYTFIRDFQVISIDIEPNNHRENLHHGSSGLNPVTMSPVERTPLIT